MNNLVERLRDYPPVEDIVAAATRITTLEAENKRLREALEDIRDGYGPQHLSKYCMLRAKAALSSTSEASQENPSHR